jgi:hypothetical protein
MLKISKNGFWAAHFNTASPLIGNCPSRKKTRKPVLMRTPPKRDEMPPVLYRPFPAASELMVPSAHRRYLK